MKLKYIFSFCFLCIALPIFAWDASGHRLIAAVAYQQLSPVAKKQIDTITQLTDPGYPPPARFLYAAVAPDRWRQQLLPDTAAWHYLSTPWSTDGTAVNDAPSPNLFTAIPANVDILQNPAINVQQQAIALAFVAHLVGDAHQPLHTINRFSQSHPNGDRGGNLFLLTGNQANNLHAFWDQIAQYFLIAGGRYPLSNKTVMRLAKQLQQRYPASYFQGGATDIDFKNWLDGSFMLARDKVYTLPENTSPSRRYIQMARDVSEQQMVLAGYRLAYLLNTLFK